MNDNYRLRLSDAINWLRFPLIFLIILLHCYSVVRLEGSHDNYFKVLYPFRCDWERLIQAPIIRIYEWNSNNSEDLVTLYNTDGMHLNITGYQKLDNCITKKLAPL